MKMLNEIFSIQELMIFLFDYVEHLFSIKICIKYSFLLDGYQIVLFARKTTLVMLIIAAVLITAPAVSSGIDNDNGNIKFTSNANILFNQIHLIIAYVSLCTMI
jgi:hypothetical protein